MVEASTEPAARAGQTWNPDTFEGLRAALGDERAAGILSHFWLDLGRRFGERDRGEALRRDAHIVKSTAGLLGFEDLGEAAESLEAACLENRPVAALADVLDLRRRQVGEALGLRYPAMMRPPAPSRA